jgi:hypothetical protein
MIKMFISLHVKYPLFLSDFNENFSTDFRQRHSDIKYYENLCSGNRVFYADGRRDGKTDRHTDRQDKATSRLQFRYCA